MPKSMYQAPAEWLGPDRAEEDGDGAGGAWVAQEAAVAGAAVWEGAPRTGEASSTSADMEYQFHERELFRASQAQTERRGQQNFAW